jgi:hypothetical protein
MVSEITKINAVARKGKKGQGDLQCGRGGKGICEERGTEVMV